MLITNVKAYDFEAAIRGMRNPKESWHLSDSKFGIDTIENIENGQDLKDVVQAWMEYPERALEFLGIDLNTKFAKPEYELKKYLLREGILHGDNSTQIYEYAFIGPADMNLMRSLIKGGSPHCKFMRQIPVSFDLTAPLYWWKEYDTYKVSTVANSTSQMHKIHTHAIDFDCFETDDFCRDLDVNGIPCYMPIATFLDFLEQLRLKFLETNDKRYWKELIRWCPQGWLQTRTVSLNFEVIRNMCFYRHSHKLNEWSGKDHPDLINFINEMKKLPYANALLFSSLEK